MKFSLVYGQGSGNNFFLVDESEIELFTNHQQRSEFAIWACNHMSPFKADGVLFLLPSDQANSKMHIVNRDGSVASMCGNGLRLVSRYVFEKNNIHHATIETKYKVLQVSQEASIFPELPTIQVEISPISFQTKDLPMHTSHLEIIDEVLPEIHSSIRFSTIAVPNPHLIAFEIGRAHV
jgi:diaminopimelate epimerase